MPVRKLLAVVAAAVVLAACDLPRPAGEGVIRYRDQVFTGVTKTADVRYATAAALDGTPVALSLDVYRPTGDTQTRRAAVVFVHGGGYSGGDKGSGPSAEQAAEFPKLGYVTFSINYRLLAPRGGCTGATAGSNECIYAAVMAITDAQAAVRWVRTHAAEFGVDPGRIGIAGESAGGITATGVGLYAENPNNDGEDTTVSARVQGFFSISGGLPGGIFASADDAPGVLVSGTADTVVPYQWSVDTANALVNAGRLGLLQPIEGAGHVPVQEPHRTHIIQQAQYFFYYALDLANAPGQSPAAGAAMERQVVTELLGR
jgi:dipeptidyl aminopeptidase/acylaminoacyl peptidase